MENSEKAKKKFKRIYAEITNVCNLSCSFCPKTKRKKEFISAERFQFLAKAIAPFTDYIYLHIMGEPLLHPQLKDILNICGENNLHANITTNGTLLSSNINILRESRSLRKLSISVHSMEEDNFENYLTNIVLSAQQLSETTIVEYRLWNEREDNKNASFNNKVIKLITSLYNNHSVNLYSENIKLNKNTFIGLSREFEWPDLNKKSYGEKGWCQGTLSQIAILVDGTVIPCCLDSEGSVPLGNIYESPFCDIQASPRVQNMQNGFLKGHRAEEFCRHCGYSQKFTK